jgi:TetR/AcrR family transcriptional regulator, transcriptional repressor for nem operon
MPALSGDLTRETGPARACFTQGVSDMAARIGAALEAIGIADAEREANALQAQLVGAVALARAVDSAPHSDAILQDTLTQIVSRFGLDAQ